MHSCFCMRIFFIALFPLFHVIIFPNSVGSNTAVSRQAFQVFPTSENTTLLHTNDNQIIGFALMENGFALGDSGTILPFNGCLPVETKMHLNGGTLILQRNMTIDNMSTFTSLGSIVGNNHSCFFTRFLNQIGQSGSSIGYFGNLSISFESDVTLDTTLSFSGTCSIDGKNQNLILGSRGALVVQSGATLTLKNMAIRNGSGTNISCADNTSTLVLQNVTLSANAAMQFPQGKLQFNGDNVFQGSTMFAYVSTQTMLINSNSSLILDTGFTFSCAPTSGSANVLALADSTSQLFLNHASLVTMANGLNLKNGFVFIDGASSFISAQPTMVCLWVMEMLRMIVLFL